MLLQVFGGRNKKCKRLFSTTPTLDLMWWEAAAGRVVSLKHAKMINSAFALSFLLCALFSSSVSAGKPAHL